MFCPVNLQKMLQFLLLFMEITKLHQLDLKQIKSLLVELRKAKLKCLELSDYLQRDLPKLEKYQILEVRCTKTAESMDKLALIQLRHELTQSLTQLYAEERAMMQKIEKQSFKKVMRPIPARKQRQRYSKKEVGPFKIPFYYNRPQPSINKIERIANYIESIAKSMDSLRKSMEMDGNWNCQDFLQYQPQYQEMFRKIEEFKMRDQQLVQSLLKKVEEEKTKLINEAIKGEEDGQFIIMKIPKKKIDNYGRPEQEKKEPQNSRSFNQDKSYHPLSMIEPKTRTSSKKQKLEKINEEGNLQQSKNYPLLTPQNDSLELPITSFDKKLSANKSRTSKLDNSGTDQDENGNFVYVVRKLSPDSQINSSIMSSISSLRSLRKKVFDDDIWDQFQKF